jgi:hypothetical protein
VTAEVDQILWQDTVLVHQLYHFGHRIASKALDLAVRRKGHDLDKVPIDVEADGDVSGTPSDALDIRLERFLLHLTDGGLGDVQSICQKAKVVESRDTLTLFNLPQTLSGDLPGQLLGLNERGPARVSLAQASLSDGTANLNSVVHFVAPGLVLIDAHES